MKEKVDVKKWRPWDDAPWNYWLMLGNKQEMEKHWIRNEMSLPSPEEDNWA